MADLSVVHTALRHDLAFGCDGLFPANTANQQHSDDPNHNQGKIIISFAS